ncbi:hypothetical protein [Streptomyces arboris]|uniref:hypothetical protein n=1 Tax=Streptomyces arboris TaxID=2600619 RepID=UPI003BF50AAB
MKAYDRARGIAAVLAAARAADPNPDDPFEIEALDELPFVQVAHWVPLAVAARAGITAGTRAGANSLYLYLAMHLSMNRGDRYVWPTRDTLAALMGYSRADKIGPFVALLVELDALVVIKVPNGAGPEMRNVYRLRRNPPPGFTGHVLMSEIYATVEAEQGEVTGQPVHPESGADVDPESGPVTTTTPNKNKEQAAPPARSAPDVRRTTAGSSARDELNGGCAATEEPGLVADEAAEPVDGPAIDEQESAGAEGGVPVQRSSGGRQAAGKGGGRKPSPFSPELRGAIYATEALLPAQLREALAVLLPHGHLPNTTRKVTAQALETRTPEELGERAARRWVSYGYERDHYDGLLRKPIGIVEELLRPTPYCPAADCEDGADRHTGEQCIPCAERIENRKRARRAGKAVPTSRPPRIYRDREACIDCDRPLVGDTPADGLCRDCRASLDRAAAYINGPLPGADVEPEPVDEEPDPYGPCPPNAEFVHWRDKQRAEKRAAILAELGVGPPPF